MSTNISRRNLLRGVGGATTLLSLGSVSALAACTTGTTGENNAAANAKVQLPTYVPYPGVKPDLPPNDRGVVAGFLSYPANPVQAVTQAPGRGGKVSVMTLTYGAVPPAADRNQYWQELNKRLGTELAINVVPNADYANKVATVVAGGDLPDLMLFFATLKPAQFPALLRAKFADLSELVSGDAVQKYPFLANIPTQSWKNVVYNGGVYGLPIPRGLIGTIVLVRDDLIREKGLQRQPKSFAEFRELCKGLTDPKNNRWAIGNPDTMLGFLEQMSGAPSNWREDGGKFTFHYETEQAKTALNDMVTLFKDGVFHPDAIGADTVQVKQWLASGAIAINRDGAAAWAGNPVGDVPDTEKYVGAIVPPGRDGGQGVHWIGGGAFGMVAFKKADKDRLDELLRICDWLAAPFGTAEYQFRKYGLAGVHYELKDGNPALTQTGKTELTVPVNYVSDAPTVLYDAGKPNLTKAQHAFQEQVMPLGLADPTVGLISDTQMSKGAQLDKKFVDVIRDICAGRKPFSAWDETVREWRQNGGDQIRKEYQESFALRNG